MPVQPATTDTSQNVATLDGLDLHICWAILADVLGEQPLSNALLGDLTGFDALDLLDTVHLVRHGGPETNARFTLSAQAARMIGQAHVGQATDMMDPPLGWLGLASIPVVYDLDPQGLWEDEANAAVRDLVNARLCRLQHIINALGPEGGQLDFNLTIDSSAVMAHTGWELHTLLT